MEKWKKLFRAAFVALMLTQLTMAFVNSLIKSAEQNDVSSISANSGDAREAVKNIVKEKMRYFGSEGKVEISGPTTCIVDKIWKSRNIFLYIF